MEECRFTEPSSWCAFAQLGARGQGSNCAQLQHSSTPQNTFSLGVGSEDEGMAGRAGLSYSYIDSFKRALEGFSRPRLGCNLVAICL